MHFDILTLYPTMFPGCLAYSLAGKALQAGLWSYKATDIRAYADDAYKTVDDIPFGGGAGMVMKVDVLDRALQDVYKTGPLLYMSPRGKPLTQAKVIDLAKEQQMTILCGHFEGVDERIFDLYPIEEVSLGDYVLSGGEPAALAMMDAVLRYVPGVLGNIDSLTEESFSQDLLEYPQYTRPQSYKGLSVPEVLLSGHHQKIKDWREQQSHLLTQKRRPDLWLSYQDSQHKKG